MEVVPHALGWLWGRNRIGRKAKDPFPVKPRYFGGKPLFLVDELDCWLQSLPT